MNLNVVVLCRTPRGFEEDPLWNGSRGLVWEDEKSSGDGGGDVAQQCECA